ncbi:hypothetical protein [Gilliamella apicola]|uniref:hypothetical protein n=2 Tax=Gilliamella apicola TaxID=1196095 RepID=UPI001553A16B|nr:hypothetical protein [Gilliamella apicola]
MSHFLHVAPPPHFLRPPEPLGRWCGCMACRHDPAGVFQSASRGHRRRSRSVQYGSAVRYTLRSGGVRHRNGNTGYRWRFVCCGHAYAVSV